MTREMLNKHVIIRSSDAGVFAGTLLSKRANEVTLSNARRIWYWEGAASLSQLSQEGTTLPDKCKFPMEVPLITIIGVCEIIPTTEKAKKSIDSVPLWQA